MSESNNAASSDQPIINDAITAQDAGFDLNAGERSVDEKSLEAKPVAEGKEELQEKIEEAIDNGASKKEVQNMIREFKLKVNGKEVSKKLDLSDDAAIIRELQLAAASQPAMQRAKELEKSYERELNRLMQNPWEVLQELGMNPEELSTRFLEDKVKEMKKSPEQVEKEKLESEVKQYREQMKKFQEESENARMQQLQEQESVRLEKEIMEALEVHKTLPKSQRTVSRIADALLWAMENGFESATVADVLPAVEADLRSEISGFMQDLPNEMFEEWVGKNKLDNYRKQRLGNVKKQQDQPQVQKVQQTTQSLDKGEDKKAKQKLRTKDYFRSI